MASHPATGSSGSGGRARASGFWPLFRVTVISAFGPWLPRRRDRRERLSAAFGGVLSRAAVVALVAVVLYVLYGVAQELVTAGLAIGRPEAAFSLSLQALPLKPETIVLAKLGAVLIGEYLLLFVASLPLAVAYAGGGYSGALGGRLAGAVACVLPAGGRGRWAVLRGIRAVSGGERRAGPQARDGG